MDDSLDNNITVISTLGESGLLSDVIEGFQTRDSQIEMAKIIDQSMIDSEHAVIEAGTGIGKSFAYLVPAFLSGKKNPYFNGY